MKRFAVSASRLPTIHDTISLASDSLLLATRTAMSPAARPCRSRSLATARVAVGETIRRGRAPERARPLCLLGLAPAGRGGSAGDLYAFLGAQLSRSGLAALAPESGGGPVLAIIRRPILDLSRRDPADHDGGADHVSRSLLASGHR